MNAHVNRRTVIAASAGVAVSGILPNNKSAEAAALNNEPAPEVVLEFASIDERLDRLPADVANRLRAAFNELFDEIEAMIERGESDAAIIAYSENWFHGQRTL